MLEIATNGELFNRMLPVLKDFTIHGIELVAQAGADAVFLADDWGIQDRLMVSPASWVKYFKPA
jgi:uroporphyrinogen-III decarboxylase